MDQEHLNKTQDTCIRIISDDLIKFIHYRRKVSIEKSKLNWYAWSECNSDS
jgi:hypothetical protein